jgi:hypothetical protein
MARPLYALLPEVLQEEEQEEEDEEEFWHRDALAVVAAELLEPQERGARFSAVLPDYGLAGAGEHQYCSKV